MPILDLQVDPDMVGGMKHRRRRPEEVNAGASPPKPRNPSSNNGGGPSGPSFTTNKVPFNYFLLGGMDYNLQYVAERTREVAGIKQMDGETMLERPPRVQMNAAELYSWSPECECLLTLPLLPQTCHEHHTYPTLTCCYVLQITSSNSSSRLSRPPRRCRLSGRRQAQGQQDRSQGPVPLGLALGATPSTSTHGSSSPG